VTTDVGWSGFNFSLEDMTNLELPISKAIGFEET
jgi:hypothetical protein